MKEPALKMDSTRVLCGIRARLSDSAGGAAVDGVNGKNECDKGREKVEISQGGD